MLFMRETLRTCYPLQERSGNLPLVTLAPTAAQGVVNELQIGSSQLTLQVLVPSSPQMLKWKWDIHIITSQFWNNNHMKQTVCTNIHTNSPVKLAWIRSWNSLSNHIVHTIKGTADVYTGDGWTANTRTRRDGSSLLFIRKTLRARYPLQERSGNLPLVMLAPTAAQGLGNELHIGSSQLTLQVLVPSSAQVLKWKWDIHIITSQCWNDNHMTQTVCANIRTNSPV